MQVNAKHTRQCFVGFQFKITIMYVNSHVPKQMHYLEFSDDTKYNNSKCSKRDCG